ncbi:tbc1d2b [Symbiodinium natans]|uniref:Tbc1d2b protein n=1 Tax=Symbiodinium natans TaxID=878477 RepID=A0A812RER2_9DINO|nr:tbc1d2b [Symbiodinium natans]
MGTSLARPNVQTSLESLELSPELRGHSPHELLAVARALKPEPGNRTRFWQLCLGVEPLKEEEPCDVLAWLLQLPSPDADNSDECIRLDVPRTPVPEHMQSSDDFQHNLHAVLLAYARRNPAIGYKSGMSFIAGALLGEMDREDAFWCFCAIIERMLPPGIFEDGSRARFEEATVFPELLRKTRPKLHAHLEREMAYWHGFLHSWIYTLFTYLKVPYVVQLRLWDGLFLRGFDGLHQVGLAIFQQLEPILLACRGLEEASHVGRDHLPIDWTKVDFLDLRTGVDNKFIEECRRSGLLEQQQRAPIRRYVLEWSIHSHHRFRPKRKRSVLAVLMLQRRCGSLFNRLSKALWLNKILPLT